MTKAGPSAALRQSPGARRRRAGLLSATLLAATALPGPLSAQEVRLICENPRREYLVIYQPGAPALQLDPDSEATLYPVLVDDSSDAAHVVTAETPNGGPTARLHLRPYLKLEFWSSGQLIQTDGCYRTQ